MSLKFLIKSFDRRCLAGILALIFLLTMALSDVTLSEESQATQGVLRKASLRWMQLGIKQYQSDLFTEAELSFRRACVFKKYLTDAERQELDEYLAKARIAISEGKQAVADTQTADEPVEPNQPDKAEVNAEKVKDSEPLAAIQQQQTEKEPRIINSQIEQKVQTITTAEPSVSKIQLAAESSQDVIVVKDKSFNSRLYQLSDWLTQNRRNILMIGLPVLAVLVIISKLQGLRNRPRRRLYTNHVPANTSYIGSRLNGNNGGNGNNRPGGGLGNGRLAYAAVENPKRKSFTQSTDHWKEKHANHAPAAKAGQKQCGKCKDLKPHSDFHKNKSSKDGLASWCKECKKQYRKKSV